MGVPKWLEAAREQGYLVARENRSTVAKRNAWFRDCERRDAGPVEVMPRRNYATVQMDLIASSFRCPEKDAAALRRLQVEYSAGRMGPVILGWGSTLIWLRDVLVGRAEECARRLAEMGARWQKDPEAQHEWILARQEAMGAEEVRRRVLEGVREVRQGLRGRKSTSEGR